MRVLHVNPDTLHKLPHTRQGTRLEGFMMQYTNYGTRYTILEGLMNCSPTSARVFGIFGMVVCVLTLRLMYRGGNTFFRVLWVAEILHHLAASSVATPLPRV